MESFDKTREKPIQELKALRQRVAKLGKLEAEKASRKAAPDFDLSFRARNGRNNCVPKGAFKRT